MFTCAKCLPADFKKSYLSFHLHRLHGCLKKWSLIRIKHFDICRVVWFSGNTRRRRSSDEVSWASHLWRAVIHLIATALPKIHKKKSACFPLDISFCSSSGTLVSIYVIFFYYFILKWTYIVFSKQYFCSSTFLKYAVRIILLQPGCDWYSWVDGRHLEKGSAQTTPLLPYYELYQVRIFRLMCLREAFLFWSHIPIVLLCKHSLWNVEKSVFSACLCHQEFCHDSKCL